MDGFSGGYSHLYELLNSSPAVEASATSPAAAAGLDMPAPAVLSTASAPDQYLQARNEQCPFCERSVTIVDRPVALLPCGHAYHVFCGQGLLFAPEGRQCTLMECHKSDEDVERERLRRVVSKAVEDGKFSWEDLRDPVLARDIRKTIASLVEKDAASGPMRRRTTASNKATDDNGRSLAAYEKRWKAVEGGVSEKGFSFKAKMKILFPYMKNPAQVSKVTNLNMAFLLDKEEDMHKRATTNSESDSESDDADDAARTTGIVASSLGGEDKLGPVTKRISVKRFINAGLTVSDVYFGLQLQSWQDLVDYGLKRNHLTNAKGPFHITEVADMYSVDYETFVEDLKWSLNDAVKAGLKASDLASVGLTFDRMWEKMELQKADFALLGFSPKEWHTDLDLQKHRLVRPLEMTKRDLKRLGWSVTAFRTTFDLHEIDMQSLGIGAPTVAPAQFFSSDSDSEEEEEVEKQPSRGRSSQNKSNGSARSKGRVRVAAARDSDSDSYSDDDNNNTKAAAPASFSTRYRGPQRDERRVRSKPRPQPQPKARTRSRAKSDDEGPPVLSLKLKT